MSATISSKVEIFFLTFFRWVVLLVLLSMFIVMGYFATKGVREYPLSRTEIALEKKSPPKHSFSKDDFITEINSKKVEEEQAIQPVAIDNKVDDAESGFLTQVDALWSYVSKYQTDCQLQDPLTKSQFTESLRPTALKELLQSHEADFAASQGKLVKDVLASKAVVDLCKSGKKGIFISLLDYHLHKWNLQDSEIKAFEDAEVERINQLAKAEDFRIATQHAEAQRSFMIAGFAFLIFMGIAIILIFARIESNLRGVQLK